MYRIRILLGAPSFTQPASESLILRRIDYNKSMSCAYSRAVYCRDMQWHVSTLCSISINVGWVKRANPSINFALVMLSASEASLYCLFKIPKRWVRWSCPKKTVMVRLPSLQEGLGCVKYMVTHSFNPPFLKEIIRLIILFQQIFNNLFLCNKLI